MKRFILSFIFSTLLAICYGQSGKDSLITVKLEDCLGKKLNIQIPSGYGKIYSWSDTCGFFIKIPYADGSLISVCCDGMNITDIKEEIVNETHNKTVRVNGLFIEYYFVPSERVHLFNKAFNLLASGITDIE